MLSSYIVKRSHEVSLLLVALSNFSVSRFDESGIDYMEHEDGTRISSVNQVTVGERMKTYVKDGVIWSNVEKTEHSEEWNASRDKEPDNCE